MRLKSFQAHSMSEAMRLVKDALGDDAIIVSTKETPSGLVRITAAVEQINPEPEDIKESLKKEEAGQDEDTVIETITTTLLNHRVPSATSDKIISAAILNVSGDPQKTLAAALTKTFDFSELNTGKKNKPIILVGPPGAGKTLTTAKLAAQDVLDGKRPVIITTDIARAGGIEQLQAFLDIMSLTLLQAEDAKTLKAALAKAGNASRIIVDTGGLNPFDPQEMKTLAKLIAVEDMVPTLVLPAGIDAEESAEMAMTFEVLGVKHFIPTRLDFARRFGGLLSAADRTGIAFTEASHTPQVANGLIRITPQKLASLLMPHSPKQDSIKKRGKP